MLIYKYIMKVYFYNVSPKQTYRNGGVENMAMDEKGFQFTTLKKRYRRREIFFQIKHISYM